MKRQRSLFFDTLLLGVVGALGAQVFNFLLHLVERISLTAVAGYVPPGLPNEGGVLQQLVGPHGLILIPIVITLGGLISGILVYSVAPEAEGHGTDTAVRSFHRSAGVIRPRVTPLKIVSSAITIGTGGAAGREGPTALISAGIGSIYGSVFKRSERERRLLVLIGMASGLSAIFRSPVGTAIFAIEVLYSEMEFEAGALLYSLLGSIVAYTLNGLFVGWKPLFQVPSQLTVDHFSDYLWYVLLGVASGLIGVMLPSVFYKTRDLFHRLPIPPHFKPALGALGVGVIALYLPQVLGGGYGWIQETINGNLPLKLLGILLFAKMISFAFTVSSGGSGGVFAPSLFVGAMLGGFLAQVFHQPSAAFAVVGMAAVFGSAARVPIATLLMVVEMTGGYHLLVAAALAVTLAYLVQSWITARLSVMYPSLYEAQVPGRIDSPAHRMEHIQSALKMLGRDQVEGPQGLSSVNLFDLLESGVPLEIESGKRLFAAVLSKESPAVGRSIAQGEFASVGNSPGILSILRQGKVFSPRPDSVLAAGDHLLIAASLEQFEKLKPHFEAGPGQE